MYTNPPSYLSLLLLLIFLPTFTSFVPTSSSHPPASPLQATPTPDPSIDSGTTFPLAKPLSFKKFLTLQEKRVVTTIRYTGGIGLRRYFLTSASLLKRSNPDVLIEKVVLPNNKGFKSGSGSQDAVFEILVDGKPILGRSRVREVGEGVWSVYFNREDLEEAIKKARRRRRPETLYNTDEQEGSGNS
mmetsp:Transcript_6438/g.12718  ORF Transcript_6438/g.12718 Transcript_6438/m.12718 type:complete len:187 (-) Transcript_6438:12-572(-)